MSTKISWYVQEEEDYSQNNEHYLGSFSPQDEIILKLQVWNNRYGTTIVDTIVTSRLSVCFDNYEDGSILKYCTISINDSSFESLDIQGNKGVVNLGMLSGNYNNGLDTSDNAFNFKNIVVKFTDLPQNLKNGIKNMILDIELD